MIFYSCFLSQNPLLRNQSDMAEGQEIGNLSAPNNPRVTNNITKRNEQYLLLSTMYPLNFSHMKKLHIGLQSTNERTFEPNVKLVICRRN